MSLGGNTFPVCSLVLQRHCSVLVESRGRRMRLSACDFGYVTRVQWLQHTDGADVGCVGCGVVYELDLLVAGTFLLECNDAVISNSETPTKQVRRHEDLACAAVSQVVRSMCQRLRFDLERP